MLSTVGNNALKTINLKQMRWQEQKIKNNNQKIKNNNSLIQNKIHQLFNNENFSRMKFSGAFLHVIMQKKK